MEKVKTVKKKYEFLFLQLLLHWTVARLLAVIMLLTLSLQLGHHQ